MLLCGQQRGVPDELSQTSPEAQQVVPQILFPGQQWTGAPGGRIQNSPDGQHVAPQERFGGQHSGVADERSQIWPGLQHTPSHGSNPGAQHSCSLFGSLLYAHWYPASQHPRLIALPHGCWPGAQQIGGSPLVPG